MKLPRTAADWLAIGLDLIGAAYMVCYMLAGFAVAQGIHWLVSRLFWS